MAERMVSETPKFGVRPTDKTTSEVSGFTWKMVIVALLVVLLGGALAVGFWYFIGGQQSRIATENTATRPAEP